jgi:hypothetical protein
MIKYFYIGRFIEFIKDKYPMVSKIIIYFDPIKSTEKTKYKDTFDYLKETRDYNLLDRCFSTMKTRMKKTNVI